MSQCKKFAPNIFHKTKCSNCFRQKEEHSAEALECNRASRSVARSGYLFVAPDWDFSVPLNRTKRWQRRWFVLYDDGELNYSVDEHPDTVPQGSVDMSRVLEVTGAEQVTGHPHSLALTSPDRVTFVKAASREDARWWAELLAVFPRRHKRNATFPGGRASPSLPQLGRSASPQPPRPRHLSCTGPSPRTNFTTPPLKEERESSAKDKVRRSTWLPERTSTLPIASVTPKSDCVITSGSPPTRDKLRCEDKVRTRRDWRHERLRDIATALTDRSPESSLTLPAEGLLNLKKGWLWYKDNAGEWLRRWWVLCGPALKAFHDQDEQGVPELNVELSTITDYSEITTEIRYGFQIQWSGPTLVLSAVTSGIRSNWLQALKKAAPSLDSPPTPATPRSGLLSSDEEYRTASEGGRRDSEDWGELPPSPLTRTTLAKVKERTRLRSKYPRNQSRQSTVDSVSTDELDACKEPEIFKLRNTINKQTVEIDGLRQQYSNALNDVQALETELVKFKKLQSEALVREQQAKETLQDLERTERGLNQKLKELDEKHVREQKSLQFRLTETERMCRECEDKCLTASRELQTKQKIIGSLQGELNCVNERHTKSQQENDRLYRKVQEMECRPGHRRKQLDSLADLTNVNLDTDFESLGQNELIKQCLDLRNRFEKAVLEIHAVKRELRDSHVKYDRLELENLGLKKSLKVAEQETEAQSALMAERVQDLTTKLAAVEKQARSLKAKLQDSREKRRSLSLKGRESFSINKEVEDKITELEAKILSLERNRLRRKHKRERSSERASPIDDRYLRRLRRKSLDSATSSEPMKLLMRLSNLENKVSNVTTSNESLNALSTGGSNLKTDEMSVKNLCEESVILAAKKKLAQCKSAFNLLQTDSCNVCSEQLNALENDLSELSDILNSNISESEVNVIRTSVSAVVKRLETLLKEKLENLNAKARTLKESNQLSNHTKLEILAEKIAYENIIVSRIQDALHAPAVNNNTCERLLSKEAIETAHLLSSLQEKLKGVIQKQLPTFKTSADYLTKVLTKRLIIATHGYSLSHHTKNTFSPILKYLENEQGKISLLLNSYKSDKLLELADSLACETINLAADQTCHLDALDKETVDDIWKTARETVNSELIQSEINHVLVHTARLYEGKATADQNYFFSFFAYERAALELWSDSVESQLRMEIEKNIGELTETYKVSLNRLQRQNLHKSLESERTNTDASVLLHEFADIIAHKALIDARITVLKSEYKNSLEDERSDFSRGFLLNYLKNDEYWNSIEEIGLAKTNSNLEAEFKCMLSRYSSECSRALEQLDLMDIRNALQELSTEICGLIGSNIDEQIQISSMKEVYHKCQELKKRLIEAKKVVLEAKYSTKLDTEEERRPLYLGTEYLNQVENLRAAYRRTSTECENRRQQADLEQLQVLCERVLVAMEHWHRRTLQDLREQHSRELQTLRQDKEQALAEETQATLAALDAMRKAHEAEVQREVAKFKQDFARRQQDELLELTERLSVKCLEAAALEEQLGSTTRQLIHAQQHILQLERNPQLSMQN